MNTDKFFMYGHLITFNDWLNKKGSYSIADSLNFDEDDIRGIFTGKDGKFIILGKVLDCVNDDAPYVVPELDEVDKHIIRIGVKDKFDFEGEFNYYFVTQKP